MLGCVWGVRCCWGSRALRLPLGADEVETHAGLTEGANDLVPSVGICMRAHGLAHAGLRACACAGGRADTVLGGCASMLVQATLPRRPGVSRH